MIDFVKVLAMELTCHNFYIFILIGKKTLMSKLYKVFLI